MSWQGIDVSKWQGEIDWNAVRDSGKTFAIISQADGDYNNPYWDSQLDGAIGAGLHVGAYYFTHATSDEESRQDARDLIAAIGGRKVDMPLYIDIEDPAIAGVADSIARAWCDECGQNGYKGGLYCNLSWYNAYFDQSYWADKHLWIARYDATDCGTGDAGIWQYSQEGSCPGVDGNCDMNEAFVEEWTDLENFPTVVVDNPPAPQKVLIKDPIADKIDADKGNFRVKYQVHVQYRGWMDVCHDGDIAGTTGQSLRLEALAVEPLIPNIGIEVNGHVQNIGWQGWRMRHYASGTSGGDLRLEAAQMRLNGVDADKYDIYYRMHIQSIGWLDWSKNGEIAGSTGCSLRCEAIQVLILDKGQKPEGTKPISNFSSGQFQIPSLTCQAHVHNIGWMNSISGGSGQSVTIGTTGMSLALECIRATVNNHGTDMSLSGSPHISVLGWCKEQNGINGIGSTGQSRPLEAIKIDRNGSYKALFDIWYRCHVQNVGWMDWAKNGAMAGTEGFGLRMEAMEIVLLPSGSPAPGPTKDAYRKFVPTQPSVPTTPVVSHDYRSEICAVAQSQIGYVEENDWTQFGQWYQDTFNAPGFAYGEWCDMFVSWCARQVGVSEDVFKSCAYVPSHVQWFANKGWLKEAYGAYAPQPGDLVFFNWSCAQTYNCDHVGMVIDFDGTNITTVEGNTGSGTPCVMVKNYSYTDDYIIWYGSPGY